MEKRTGLDLAILVAGFFVVWTAWVIVAWKLEFVPEMARPWLRTAIWISAALIWVRWQKTKAPLTWLALKPVNASIVAVSAASPHSHRRAAPIPRPLSTCLAHPPPADFAAIDHAAGRSLVWVLAHLRAMIETQTLERLEQRLEELAPSIEGKSHGHTTANRPPQSTH